MSKFTKGPWVFKPAKGFFLPSIEIRTVERRYNVAIFKDCLRETDGVLMSAAPDMYEALDTLCKLDDHDVYTNQSWCEALMAARAALAKADGKGE